MADINGAKQMDEQALRAFAKEMRDHTYARETLLAVLDNPEIDSSSLVIDSVFRSLILDEGYGQATAKAVYEGLILVADARPAVPGTVVSVTIQKASN